MKITVFTSNQPRHLSLIRDLAAISEEVFAIIEVNTVFPGKKADFFSKSEIMQDYFSHVMEAEKRVFGNITLLPHNVRALIVKSGDLNEIPISILQPTLCSNEYVIFGSSFIKGELIEFLVANHAINIHMGVSPYYRGSSCNFWAGYDHNINMIGSTIHLLSRGLDSGPILCHCMPNPTGNIFDLGMMAVKSAHKVLVRIIASQEINTLVPIRQNKELEIRYTRNSDFTDDVAREFLEHLPTENEIIRAIEEVDLESLIVPIYF